MSSQELEKLLAGLREQTRGVEAPKRVEATLLAAFRAETARPARHGVRSGWISWALAAAATVTVIVGAGVWKLEQPVPSLPAARFAMAPPPVVAQPGLPQPAPPPVVAKRVSRPARPHVEAVKPELQPVQEVATDFMPLEDSVALPPIESGHILRVSMPQSTMVRFGFPVNPDRFMEPVKADVMFGQDGIARAVRFVR
jgi:hypothetical protein